MTIPQALVKLSRSKFRGRFKLDEKDRETILTKGMEAARTFAEERVSTALALAFPEKDGHQTPLRGHPVFKAQHATAMCCRTCMNHWWNVPIGVALTPEQQLKAVNLIMAWIDMQMKGGVEELKKTMTQEEIDSIPMWRQQGPRFQCPYRVNDPRKGTKPLATE